ncbi:PQQ-binding-like beta-propeller repeat protein [Streptomyces sp. NPDC097619]|uniref:outer membrane protein assembly factor BamB family protein n=1 Tax=Streptomyces sp. NPDC097619 TaxID=3157228 RepID=UPI00331F5D21
MRKGVRAGLVGVVLVLGGLALGVLMAVVLGLAGVGGAGGGAPRSERPPEARVTGPFTAHRPPLRFQPEGVLPGALVARAAVLDGARAHVIGPERLTTVDLASGAVLWSVAPLAPVPDYLWDAPPEGPPVVTAVAGRRLVLAAFATGAGASELLALDADRGTVVHRIRWDGPEGSGAIRCTLVAVAGPEGAPARARTAVVSCVEGEYRTYGIPLSGRGPSWWVDGFQAGHALVGDRIAGDFALDDSGSFGGPARAAALDARTGRVLWRAAARPEHRSSEGALRPFSPFLLLAGPDVLDARTGRKRDLPGLRAEHPLILDCRHDGGDLTACAFLGSELAVHDARSGRRLWQWGGRTARDTFAPTLRGARDGLLYATEGPGTHLVLDGRTGAVLERRAGAAPVLVNAFAGLEEMAPGAYGTPLAVFRTRR